MTEATSAEAAEAAKLLANRQAFEATGGKPNMTEAIVVTEFGKTFKVRAGKAPVAHVTIHLSHSS